MTPESPNENEHTSTAPAPESKGVAIVTGAAQGIGRAIALRLADDGYDVGINDLVAKLEPLEALEKDITSKGRKCLVIPGDVSTEEDVRGMVEKTVEVLGGIDVMVANAGIFAYGTIVESSLEDFNRHFSVNVCGTFLCYKYAGMQMIKQGRGGRIIGASSLAGKQGISSMGAYCSSKFAITGLTQTAAKEFGPHSITVNAYAPSSIETEMGVALFQGANDEILRVQNEGSCIPQLVGKPEDVASLVSFLVSKDAYMITGQTVSINGGRYFD